jgi:hypothetical protein
MDTHRHTDKIFNVSQCVPFFKRGRTKAFRLFYRRNSLNALGVLSAPNLPVVTISKCFLQHAAGIHSAKIRHFFKQLLAIYTFRDRPALVLLASTSVCRVTVTVTVTCTGTS